MKKIKIITFLFRPTVKRISYDRRKTFALWQSGTLFLRRSVVSYQISFWKILHAFDFVIAFTALNKISSASTRCEESGSNKSADQVLEKLVLIREQLPSLRKFISVSLDIKTNRNNCEGIMYFFFKRCSGKLCKLTTIGHICAVLVL